MVFTDGELWGQDWPRLGAEENLLVVLDRMPRTGICKKLKEFDINYIVAEAA